MVRKIKKDTEQDMISSIYASRLMQEPISKYTMPEKSISSEIAYQLIHDELNLDGKPSQNLASFVTTWMEKPAQTLINEGVKLNLADEDEYPHVIKFEERCINMISRLFNADPEKEPMGTGTIGSSEAVMLAGLAMKWRWKNKREKDNKPTDKPNLIMGENVQVVWDKFVRYFDVEPRFIPMKENRFVISPEEVIELADKNTIGVCAILGTTFTGEFEPIEEINNSLEKLYSDTGLDIPIHVDAASGGFVAPFLYPDLKWDFRLSRVVSINVSGHKYGLVYPGIGWVIWKSKEYLPEDLIFHVNYLGGDLPTFTLNFSRPASFVIAQYYNLIRLGKEGYTNIMNNLQAVSNYIENELNTMELFEIVSKKDTLPLVAWKVKYNDKFDAYNLSDKLKEFGWIVPAYSMPKNAENITVLRAVVREHLSMELAQDFIEDVKRAVSNLQNPHIQIIRDKMKKNKIC